MKKATKNNKKADIRSESIGGVSYVYVLDKHGKECFRREKTTQTIAVAHAIYMCEKYGEDYDVITLEETLAA